MKSAVLSLCALSAMATAPPRISLDLQGAAVHKLDESISRVHDLNYVQPDGTTPVGSRQDYTMRCKANTDTHATCPLPIARAFDHIDQEVHVQRRIFQLDQDGDDQTHELSAVADMDYTKCSTYLVKYDAKDEAGNHAEQVVFGLILDDTTAPTINMCDGVAESVEAASSWWLCSTSTSNDNVYGDVTPTIRYTVDRLNENTAGHTLAKDRTIGELAHSQEHALAGTPEQYDAALVNSGSIFLKDWTHSTGKYLVTLTAHDSAGRYGRVPGQNNVAQARKAINIKDTRAPWININGAEPAYWECNNNQDYHSTMKYDDTEDSAYDSPDMAGATATDLLDGVIPAELITTDISVEWGSLNPDTSVVGDNTIHYTVQDNAQNQATATRTVKVVDTLKPTITLNANSKGEIDSIVQTAGTAFEDPGVESHDLCTGDLTSGVTMSWNRPFPVPDHKYIHAELADHAQLQLGKFVRTYTTVDASANKNFVTRVFIVQDTTAPIITIQGQEDLTVNATRAGEYVDKGATCEDFTEGSLSHAVEVSGDVVNMRIPGTYTIQYDCQDLSGNSATPRNRVVTVQDISCPRVTVLGATLNYIESGFPYIDAGATATDDLDGDITKLIETDGDTVDTAEVFYQRRSCQEIATVYPQAKTGEYYITTFNSAKNEFARTLVWCYMDTTTSTGTTTGYTFFTTQAETAVVPFTSNASPDCEKYGLEMLKLDALAGTAAETNLKRKFAPHLLGISEATWHLHAENTFFPVSGAATNDLICSTNDWAMDYSKKLQATLPSTSAVKGKFVIEYHVEDRAGNTECETGKRTVIVKDTLNPVADISVTDLNKRMSGEGAVYMAEESQAGVSSGWVIGAAASAVTGLALLGFSQRKTVATTVPV